MPEHQEDTRALDPRELSDLDLTQAWLRAGGAPVDGDPPLGQPVTTAMLRFFAAALSEVCDGLLHSEGEQDGRSEALAFLRSDRAHDLAREAVAAATATGPKVPEPSDDDCRRADYVLAYLIRHFPAPSSSTEGGEDGD